MCPASSEWCGCCAEMCSVVEHSSLPLFVIMRPPHHGIPLRSLKDGLSINTATDDGHAEAFVLQGGKIYSSSADEGRSRIL